MNKKEIYIGSFLAMFSAMLWGVSGAVGQYLFRECNFTPEWLVSTRMICSGILMLLILYLKRRGEIFKVFKNSVDAKDMILFAVFGMLGTQFTYFVAIGASNAATATVLQYLAPVLIMIYITIRLRKFPSFMEILAVVCALLGTFLLATHGNIRTLSISGAGLFWGLASAVGLAFYSVQPKRLLSKYDALTLIGWAMFIGGMVISFIYPPWKTDGIWNITSIMFLVFMVLLCTLVPYSCYLLGVKMVGATKASLFASLEPLSSTLVSVVWLKVALIGIDYIGFAFILGTVFLLSVPFPRPKKKEDDCVEQSV